MAHNTSRFTETFLLPEGPVVIDYPINMSVESVSYFEEHMCLALKKAKARMEKANVSNSSNHS